MAALFLVSLSAFLLFMPLVLPSARLKFSRSLYIKCVCTCNDSPYTSFWPFVIHNRVFRRHRVPCMTRINPNDVDRFLASFSGHVSSLWHLVDGSLIVDWSPWEEEGDCPSFVFVDGDTVTFLRNPSAMYAPFPAGDRENPICIE